jgi:membrane fusion protein, heavy metal efflux system
MGHTETKRQAAALILLACACLVPARAAPPKTAGCLIEPEQTADVGTPVTGVIEELPVQLGDAVRIGQALVVLRADVEKANAQAAQMRSSVDAEARAAQANLSLAQQKVERARQLLNQHFVSEQALEQAQAEADVARQKHRLAVAQQQIYRQEQNVAKAQVGLRTLRSPISGIVVERYSNLGERVEDRPVIKVASIDPLKVTLMVPMAQYGQVKEGDTLSIQPDLPGLGSVHAQVQYVDKVVDAASNTFRVRLRLPNPQHRLPGGLRCKADLINKVAARPAASGSSPAASAVVSKVLPVHALEPLRPAQPAMKLSHGLSTRPARAEPAPAGQSRGPKPRPPADQADHRPDKPFKLTRQGHAPRSESQQSAPSQASLAHERLREPGIALRVSTTLGIQGTRTPSHGVWFTLASLF